MGRTARIVGLVTCCAIGAGCGRWGFDGQPAGDGDGDGDGDPLVDAAIADIDAAVRPSVPREWSSVTTAMTPGQIFGGKLTYFPPNQSVLLYGGTRVVNDVPGASSALWEYANGDWSEVCDLCPAGSRVGHEYVFDASQGLTLLFGGSDATGAAVTDVWHYSVGTGWRVHGTTGTGPGPMNNFSAAYDVARQVNVIITDTNEVYELAGTVWSGPLDAVPGGRSDQGTSATYDAERGGVVVYGGETATGTSLDDAWLWDGVAWTEVCTECTGAARTRASVVYDPVLRETFVIGGDTGAPIGGTWTLGEATSVDDKPAARSNAAVAYDINRDVIVLFGGRSPNCPGTFNTCDDTLEMALKP